MRELVCKHSLDLLRIEAPPEALGHRNGCVLRAPAGRERVRDVRRHDGDLRLRQVGHRAETLHHRVQLRRFLARGDLRAGGRKRELVRGVVLEEGEADHDHEHRDQADVQRLEQDDGEDDVQQAEQPAGGEHAQRQT